MPDLNVSLFGSFEVRAGGGALRGFESMKTRLLFAYLALGDVRPQPSRARLAALLWPDLPEKGGRRNLRQSLYNIRQTLADGGLRHDTVVTAPSGALALAPELAIEVDVLTFEQLLASCDNGDGGPGAEALTAALHLYRGEFLEGFYLDEGLELEEWLLLRRERLRDLAIDGMRSLVDQHRERGGFKQAAEVARRWLGLDPLAEEAHRVLMELYARAGQRSRAIAQYESCANLLRVELDVEPLAETTQLLEAIVSEEIAQSGGVRPQTALRPPIPLVGRREAYAALRESYRRLGDEGGRLVVVEGRAGVGRTRLVKTFLHNAAAQEGVRVLLARALDSGRVPATFGPLTDLFGSARVGDPEGLRDLLQKEATLASFVTALGHDRGEGAGPGLDGDALPPSAAGSALVAFARRWPEVRRSTHGEAGRLVLFFENLDRADRSTVEAVVELARHVHEARIWVICTLDSDSSVADRLAAATAASRFDVLPLGPVGADALRQLVEAVVPARQVDDLFGVVSERCGGHLLAAVELVGLLCDEGVLVAGDGGWHFDGGGAARAAASVAGVDRLAAVLARRIALLHDSARRVLVAAALMGETFEVAQLAAVSNEPMAVLEPVLHELLKRGFIRFLPDCWFESRRERDLVMWRDGAHRGVFRLASPALGEALVRSVPKARRVVIQARIARTLATWPGRRGPSHAATVASQYLAAGDGDGAVPWLARVCEGAVALGALSSARAAAELGVEACRSVAVEGAPECARFESLLQPRPS